MTIELQQLLNNIFPINETKIYFVFSLFNRPSPKPTTSSNTITSTKSSNKIEEKTKSITEATTTKDDANTEQNAGDTGGGGALEKRLTNLKTKLEESQRKVEHVREDIRGYALKRFVNYIKNYEQLLEKKFPGAMRVYRVFMDGVKLFGRDMIQLLKIRSKMAIGEKDFDTMTRRELELCHQMPRDMRRVGPIILISAIPFAHYVTMPIA